jgi:hypothetical protein
MVMQDMPSMTNEFYDRNQDPDVESINTKDECATRAAERRRDEVWPEDQAEFNRQLAVLIEQFKSYPSIIAWVSRFLQQHAVSWT